MALTAGWCTWPSCTMLWLLVTMMFVISQGKSTEKVEIRWDYSPQPQGRDSIWLERYTGMQLSYKATMQYLLTLQVSIYRMLPLQSSIASLPQQTRYVKPIQI